ncbi:MAG: RNA polymerase sigma factor FliA [Helicobacteraceae bacterium]|jgi:RNA polymerase sigma factor for flagellar operon FliA|nr:RNA polymerase sigma factor FliA [Helicobacteraceae bacterium]
MSLRQNAPNAYAAQRQDALNDLAVRFLPAVKAMAHRMKERLPASIEASDLISIGAEELIKLARRYDAELNDSFWGFAKKRVHGAMLDFLRSLDTLSRGDRKMIKDVEKLIISYFGEHNEEPSDEYLAEALKEDISKIQKARDAGDIGSLMPLDEQIQIFGGEDEVEKKVLIDEAIEQVTIALSRMNEREQTIIQLYFYEELNLKEISDILNITESRISQIIKNVTRKIRERMA